MKNQTEGERLAELGMQPIEIAKHFIKQRFPDIDEVEAIAYCRGFAKGMAVAGRKGDEAMLTMAAVATEDRLLDAGSSYMGINMVEQMIFKEQGGKVS